MKYIKAFENMNSYYRIMSERDFKDRIYGHDLNIKSDIDRYIKLNRESITEKEANVIADFIKLDELEVNPEEIDVDGIFDLECYGKNPKNFAVIPSNRAYTPASYIMYIAIYKMIDEYYYLDIHYLHTQMYYECDQLDGLIKCLSECI